MAFLLTKTLMLLMTLNRQNGLILSLLFLSLIFTNPAWSQGFLEMPNVQEVPEYEKESMLMDMDIPPVRDRDPDPEAGPRLNVREFRLQGIVEFPKLGITRQELIERVEAIRFDLMSEGEFLESGYTMDEIAEVSDLMAEIEKETEGQHVGPLEVQKLVFLIREQRRRRGVTLGMIETVADTITRYYREKGFILSKAYIPEQQVRDGVVTLTLLLGELGELKVENAKRVSVKQIESVFKDDFHEPVTSWKVEEALYLVNDIPGVTVQGFFSPGSQVGDTKLTVNVLDEKRYSANLRLDNHGSDNTSRNRVYADLKLHNPLGLGDELYLSILQSYDPDSSTYGSVRYSSFLLNPRFRVEAGFSTNDFVSRTVRSFGETLFTGESEVADVSLKYIFKRSRVKNYNMQLQYMDIATQLDTTDGQVINYDDVKKLSLSFNFDILNQSKRQLYLGSIAFHAADKNNPDVEELNVDSSEEIFTYDLSMLSFPKFPFTDYETRLTLKNSGQYTGANLSSVNQISLTGPTRARAFSVNGLQSDDGIYIGADWIFQLPSFGGATLFGKSIRDVIQPYVFADAAYGVINPLEIPFDPSDGGSPPPTGDSVEAKLADVGLGLKIKHGNLGAVLMAATPVLDKVGTSEDETPTSEFYFELQYSF